MSENKNRPSVNPGTDEPLELLRLIMRGLPLLLVVAILVTLMIKRNSLFPESSYPDNPPQVSSIGFGKPEPVKPEKPEKAVTPVKPATPTETATVNSNNTTTAANTATSNKPAATSTTLPASPVTAAASSTKTTPATSTTPAATNSPATTGTASANPATHKDDWSKKKITGPIEGAYIVVFLSRRIVALVKDQQYVRAYYYAKIPSGSATPKSARNDKRAPQGDYFIVKHELQGKIMNLIINYPSPADAAKALAAKSITAAQSNLINQAAQNKSMPPMTTPLGGPVKIRGAGSANQADPWSSGSNISIAPEQLEELWLATRKGTPVRIVK